MIAEYATAVEVTQGKLQTAELKNTECKIRQLNVKWLYPARQELSQNPEWLGVSKATRDLNGQNPKDH